MWITPLESQMPMAYPSVLLRLSRVDVFSSLGTSAFFMTNCLSWWQKLFLQGFRILCANFGRFLRFPWPVWISWCGADVYLFFTPALRSTGGRSCTCCCFRRWGIYDICDNPLTADSVPSDLARCCGTSVCRSICGASLLLVQSRVRYGRPAAWSKTEEKAFFT